MRKLKILLFILLAVPLFVLITIAEVIVTELERVVLETRIKQIVTESYENTKEIYDRFINKVV